MRVSRMSRAVLARPAVSAASASVSSVARIAALRSAIEPGLLAVSLIGRAAPARGHLEDRQDVGDLGVAFFLRHQTGGLRVVAGRAEEAAIVVGVGEQA